MIGIRVGFLIFFYLFALAKSFHVPSESGISTYKDLNTDDFEEVMLALSSDLNIWVNATEEKSSESEAVVCSNLSSRFARSLKWLFASNVKLHDANLNVQFFVSSRKQPEQVEIAVGEKFSLESTDFNIERRTVIIVHGFRSAGSNAWVKDMTKAFLDWDDVNVVVVDWSARGKTFNYFKAALTTKLIGNEIARFLHQIVDATLSATSPNETNWGTLHLVGHSLGSHISGVAAHNFKQLQDHWQVARISGLDPAGPCFNNVGAEFRLDHNDAPFVDVIHTSEKYRLTVGFGSPDSIGHVDFYPNGGRRQPGCSRVQGSIFDYIRIPSTPIAQGTCSHGRSYLYFIESLIQATTKNCTFWAHPWDRTVEGALNVISQSCDPTTCTEMGIMAEFYPQRGNFFITTSRTSPFCETDSRDKKEVTRRVKADYLVVIGNSTTTNDDVLIY